MLRGLEPYAGRPLVAAVSGGGDSMALLHMAAGWGQSPLHVLFVDHGLRDIAAEERLVADACRGLGLPLKVERWSWDRQGNLQAAARDARRAALARHATKVGAPVVLLGHTADDQAETVLLRLARGSGVDGLAGMAPVREADGLHWVRPLLNTSREDLRDWLRQRGIVWADDPSNDNPAFDRVRARQMMAGLSELGLTSDRLAQTADHMSAARTTLRKTAAAFARDYCEEDRGDLILPETLLTLDGDLERRVLAAAIGWVSGTPYKPRWSQLSALADMGEWSTLSGVLIHRKRGLRLTREHKAVADLVTPLGKWDRWQIDGPASDATVKALGESGLAQLPDWRSAKLPRQSLAASPGVWREGTLLGAPLAHFGPWSAKISIDFVSFVLSH